jgi:hypothetical protein
MSVKYKTEKLRAKVSQNQVYWEKNNVKNIDDYFVFSVW